eukprot:11795460-Alexandrium_andersonii.AAC.1
MHPAKLSEGRLDPSRWLMPRKDEHSGGTAMIAALAAPAQARCKRGRTSPEELAALVKQRSQETAVTRI